MTRRCEWRHAPEERAEDFGDFEKKVSWVLPRKKTVDFRLLAEASRRVPHVLGWGADGKASIERLCLSPYVEKPFNSKVIKSFVPELRSRKCFSCFGIPMFYVYMLWTFYVCFPYSCMGMLQYYAFPFRGQILVGAYTIFQYSKTSGTIPSGPPFPYSHISVLVFIRCYFAWILFYDQLFYFNRYIVDSCYLLRYINLALI